MRTLPRVSLAFVAAAMFASEASAQSVTTEEIPIGFLPTEWVNTAVKKTLSPQSRAVLAGAMGPLRVTDSTDRIEAARRVIQDFQKAPALVPIEISFATMAQRVVQRPPPEAPVSDRGIPVPNNYTRPSITGGPNSFVIVPSQPRSFTTRKVGAGDSVNPSATGYVTGTPEVRVSQTEMATTQARRFSVSTVLGRPVSAIVLRQVADPAALHALAVKYGAITDAEPAWGAAGTELLITPEAAGGPVMIKVAPQIVLPAAAAGQAPRRIPIPACTAGIMIARGAQTQTGLLPKTDPEFYRVFLGSQQAVDDTVTAVTLTASVQYIGNPPP